MEAGLQERGTDDEDPKPLQIKEEQVQQFCYVLELIFSESAEKLPRRAQICATLLPN